ncbi:MAG: hypothetical protein K0R54_45 [Clostridiaceae bacterium]|jgi:signal peptidase I|nr:hypothetical protein [Clostridiaceae bacterium]
MKWKTKDLFDNEFRKALFSRMKGLMIRYGRIFILLIALTYFFFLGVIPSESMLPTMEVGDLVVYQRKIDSYNRGDIISFKYPLDETVVYQKRIIGLPNEEIEIKEGIVFINDIPLEEDYLLEKPIYEYPKISIPEGSYFVLGDNRNNSEDSSVWGFVKRNKIQGKAIFTVLPLNKFGFIND